MARMMQYFREESKTITILVATSGDTGSAVGEAFRGLQGTRVIILYPENEVSPVQKKQLESIGENVQAIAFKGKFDDCQQYVKMAFSDPDLAFLNLTSANSINIGRVLPQIIYYAYIYLQVTENKEEVIFSIPSGNLGNSLGCEIARRMGLPVKKIVIGTNANNAFPKFLTTADYQKISPSKECISNAMNVGNPSNLARYFELYGGTVDKDGKVHKQPDVTEMQKNLSGYYFSDEATAEAIVEVYQKYKVIIEPHGAIGYLALTQYLNENAEDKNLKAVCVETAHPAKFPELIEKHLNITPENTPALELLNSRSGESIYLENKYEALKAWLKEF
jgi:threonine synthase